MAGVDLSGGDAQRFRDQYRNSLGRDASDDEVSGWLSSQFGGGSVDDRLRQIADSDEARQRGGGQQPQAPSLGPSPGENSGYPGGYSPGGQAVPTSPFQTGGGMEQQIADWYQQFLGRSAQGNDISQWLSGAYGWGSKDNLQGILNGIQGSGEARARGVVGAQPGTSHTMDAGATGSPYQNLDWWSSQGVPQSEIFDLSTGQIKNGWSRTANGYERAGGASNVGGPTNGNFEAWFQSVTQGKPPTPETLEAMAPMLAQYGIKLGSKGDRGWSDTIILPDGRTYDLIEGAGIGQGKRWQFVQNGGPGYTGGNTLGNVNMPGGQYSDQYTALLEMMLKMRMGQLGQPVNDPNRAMYETMLKDRAAALGGANTQVDQLMKYLQERFTDLQGPGYTGAEGEVLRTQALDPMEQDRNAAKKRVIERLGARGIGPDSGVYQDAINQVDKAFDSMRGETQTALASSELSRREDRAQRAQTIGAQLVDIPEGRAREQLDVFSALQMLSQSMRQEEDARSRESLGYAGVLSDLGPQRLQLALQAMGAGGSPESLGSSLFNIAGLNQNAAALNQRNSGSLWSGLGSVAAILARSGR